MTSGACCSDQEQFSIRTIPASITFSLSLASHFKSIHNPGSHHTLVAHDMLLWRNVAGSPISLEADAADAKPLTQISLGQDFSISISRTRSLEASPGEA
jgi:hypothetical protein